MTDTELPPHWDRLVNPHHYDAEGKLIPGAREQEAGVRLASAGPGGDGTHKASVTPWVNASGAAAELRESVETGLKELGQAHEGIGSGLQGFASATALGALRGGWEGRLAAVRNECSSLEGSLKEAGGKFGANEAGVKASFDAVRGRSRIDDYSQPTGQGR
ncbi:hypothetical protein ACFP1Z_21445 [Streptomyces gamaensis]|uniref:WXG100 family type VII secretion target n=1 Tax=Streptomyces gamaensis TaxID=1763542 RepID=A0ABW0Z4J5_9ACTN